MHSTQGEGNLRASEFFSFGEVKQEGANGRRRLSRQLGCGQMGMECAQNSSFPGAAAQHVHRIRSRAPLRLGLAGGGTDVSPYSDDFGGAILNMTIDPDAYAFIEPSVDWKIRFVATDLGIEECFPLDIDALSTARLQLHAAVYKRMVAGFAGGRPLAITVRTSVDAPAGSGLGSSSALVVALVEAFRTLLDVLLGLYEVAHLAFEIERLILNLQAVSRITMLLHSAGSTSLNLWRAIAL